MRGYLQQISVDSLPESFQNKIVPNASGDNKNKIVIRSNIKSLGDINVWVEEFGRKTATQWNVRSSNPNGINILCSKKFVCHQSSFMKIKSNENKRGNSKNAECRASILVQIKKNTKNVRYKDPYAKDGFFGVVLMEVEHSHSLNTTESLRFLRADINVQNIFNGYFSDGMGITEAHKYHKNKLELLSDDLEKGLANGSINPTLRTIQWWHKQWRILNLGARSGEGLIKVAAGSLEMNEFNLESKKKCCIPGCPGSLAMHRFPKDQARLQIWLNQIDNSDLKNVQPSVLYNNRTVCSKHFDEKCYVRNCGRKLLTKNAVPVLHLRSVDSSSVDNGQRNSVFQAPVNILHDQIEAETTADINRAIIATSSTSGIAVKIPKTPKNLDSSYTKRSPLIMKNVSSEAAVRKYTFGTSTSKEKYQSEKVDSTCFAIDTESLHPKQEQKNKTDLFKKKSKYIEQATKSKLNKINSLKKVVMKLKTKRGMSANVRKYLLSHTRSRFKKNHSKNTSS